MDIRTRKSEHIRIVCEEPVEFEGGTLLDDVHLLHDALPELSLDEIDTRTTLFGKELSIPLLCTSMTGGAALARDLNVGLAEAAASCGFAFAVGSQRVMLRHPETTDDFRVRDRIPDGVLLGNIGGQQILEHSVDDLVGLVRSIEGDGLCVHLNVPHELAQPEGARDFRGILDGIARLVDALEGRVLVKEVGCGLGPSVVKRLTRVGVRVLDVAGAGGTSWPKVESHRAEGEAREAGEALGEWGTPTGACILLARMAVADDVVIVGAGGIRSGHDVARALALGADVAGLARPLLVAFREGGTTGVVEHVRSLERALRAVMLVTGARDNRALRRVPRVITGELRTWMREAASLLESPTDSRVDGPTG